MFGSLSVSPKAWEDVLLLPAQCYETFTQFDLWNNWRSVLYVTEIRARAVSGQDGQDVDFKVTDADNGSLNGYDVALLCLNEDGVLSSGDSNPWKELSFTNRQMKTLSAGFEVMVTRTVGRDTFFGKQLSGWFPEKDHKWKECRFKVSKYEPFKIMYADDAVEVESLGDVLDNWRVGQELLGFLLIIIAPAVADSFMVWCVAGGAGGSVILSIIIIALVVRRFDSKSKGGGIVLVISLGLQQLMSTFWTLVWKPVLAAYIVAMVGGFWYCWRNRPDEQKKRALQFSMQASGCYLAYRAVSDSGAGLLAVLAQICLYKLYRNLETYLGGIFHR